MTRRRVREHVGTVTNRNHRLSGDASSELRRPEAPTQAARGTDGEQAARRGQRAIFLPERVFADDFGLGIDHIAEAVVQPGQGNRFRLTGLLNFRTPTLMKPAGPAPQPGIPFAHIRQAERAFQRLQHRQASRCNRQVGWEAAHRQSAMQRVLADLRDLAAQPKERSVSTATRARQNPKRSPDPPSSSNGPGAEP